MRELGSFITTQLLGMKWLSDGLARLLNAAGLDTAGRIGGSVHFFLYDTVKILILLAVLIFIISWIQSYFPPERTKKILGRMKGVGANLAGALLGTVTPFCSCSSIPLFIGFTSAGLPVGVTFSFLISSPLVDLGAFILLTGIFGFKIAAAYVVVGIVLAVAGGTLIDKLGMENQVELYVKQTAAVDLDAPGLRQRDRLSYAAAQTRDTVRRVFAYVLVGVGIGALIHNWVPEHVIEGLLGTGNPFSVLLAVLIGIPLYADIFGTIPVAEALYASGAGLGTILSLMMAVTALSLPSLIMLRKAVKPRLLAVFTAVVALGIVVIGYVFNALAFLF